MLSILLRSWWVLILRGLFAIMFGLIVLVWPDITVFVIVTIMGAFLMLDGMIEIWVGFLGRGRDEHWWTDAFLGIVAVLAGVAVIAWPGITAVGLMIFIGAMIAVYGATMLYQAIRLRNEMTGEGLLIANGGIALVLGVSFMIFPGAGAISLVYLIAAFFIVFGLLLVMLGWKLHGVLGDLRDEATRQETALRQEP
ncbi:MAG TPA: DUF308 domain-containing protein [Thermomicrobiales bacterium]|nr:DUF308 domain-containing protein [Thermomicrobiales bacterium]